MATAVRRAAEEATDFAWLSRGDSVLIKPVCNSGNTFPATTDPAALHAMILLLKEKGAGRVLVGDMSGVQFVRFQKDSLTGSTRALMKSAGLLQAAEELNLDLDASWMVGDAPRDIRAGQRAGCRTILLRCGGFTSMKDPQPDWIVDGIGDATDNILRS